MSDPSQEARGITVAIFDDHRPTCEALRDQLQATPGFTCVLAALSLRNAVARIECAHPDVVILDIHFPKSSGLVALADIKKARPHQRILMQTAIDAADEILMAYFLGASGYVLKGDGPNRILAAIQIVADGGAVFSPRISWELRQMTLGNSRPAWVLELTEAELKVLDLLSRGHTAKEIADERGATVSTVNKQCEAIRRKAETGHMRHALAQVAPWSRILRKFWNLWNGNGPGSLGKS